MASLSQRGPFTYLPKDAETRKGTLKLLKNPDWSAKEVCHASRPDGDQGPHAFEVECARLEIARKRIKPRTPEHNGKVERSHRTDQQKFYNRMSFYSLEDLKRQGAAWMKRYNDMPKAVLGYRSPNEKELELMPAFNQNCGVVGC